MKKKRIRKGPVRDARTLETLFATILKRRKADPGGSYTARLLSKGPGKIGDKVIEEAAEAAHAGQKESRARVVSESADVLYHLLVLWAARGIKPARVWAELARREGVSGIAEKKSRAKKKARA
ncbi:MAG: phosphoribosyl-ATP diphosphatase [Alphaproteobacteria bacterium]|nr:phosphoribosyl-ATP diphosphatase [Alphaproteobacteria bacterium]